MMQRLVLRWLLEAKLFQWILLQLCRAIERGPSPTPSWSYSGPSFSPLLSIAFFQNVSPNEPDPTNTPWLFTDWQSFTDCFLHLCSFVIFMCLCPLSQLDRKCVCILSQRSCSRSKHSINPLHCLFDGLTVLPDRPQKKRNLGISEKCIIIKKAPLAKLEKLSLLAKKYYDNRGKFRKENIEGSLRKLIKTGSLRDWSHCSYKAKNLIIYFWECWPTTFKTISLGDIFYCQVIIFLDF